MCIRDRYVFIKRIAFCYFQHTNSTIKGASLPAKVIVIGLDAAEATLIEKWAAIEELPAFARLTREGSVCRMVNSLETLPGAIWPEITSGRSCCKVPLYYHPQQLHTGEAKPRAVTHEDVDPEDYYGTIASRAGRQAVRGNVARQAGGPRSHRVCTVYY